ncbi:MAG: hypothetical protein ACF8R7_14050 [Phycisphaerales bacterium JB039]
MPDAAVLSDGDLPALICAWLAAEQGPTLVMPAAPAGGLPHPARRAVEAAADLLGAELLEAPPLTAEAGPSALLLTAAAAATGTGARRLLWPVVGENLTDMAREADRALLVSRLVALDARPAGEAALEIEAPLLDLTDSQIAEMALDLDVPIWRCWWWQALREPDKLEQPIREAAEARRDRWTTALRACGWTEATEHASIPSG